MSPRGHGLGVPDCGIAPVMGRYVTTQGRLLEISIEGSGQPLQMTRGHPVWVEEVGGWVEAQHLRAGMTLRTMGGVAKIRSVTGGNVGETVYNLSAAGGRTFFVGEQRAWAHNWGPLLDGPSFESYLRQVLGSGKVKLRIATAEREFDSVLPIVRGERKSGTWCIVGKNKMQLGQQAAIANALGKDFKVYGQLQPPDSALAWLRNKGIGFELIVP